jgi:hypothetical protein
MATILQFAERLADGQDWTASERAQLRDVGAQLDGVDVVFGKSEMGDPWCVVTDDGGEVLLHVARIGGDFVVHATHDDKVVQGDDLWSAAKRLLGDMLKERRGVLLAFPPEALGQTAVLAFLFAVVMRGEFDHWIPTSRGEPPPPVEPHEQGSHDPDAPPASADPVRYADDTPRENADGNSRGEVNREAPRASAPDAQAPAIADDRPDPARGDEAPAADHHSPAPAQGQSRNPSPVQAPAQPDPSANRGGAAGAGQTEMASFNSGGGGDAQTTSTSEPSPQAPLTEFIEGGDGDDRIAMSGKVAASGGGGADTFVLTLPTAVHGAPVLLGVVADFHAAEGDKLELSGRAVVVVDRTETDLLSTVRTQPGAGAAMTVSAGSQTMPVMTGRHIGYDLDGDGREDAYVLVTDSGGTWFTNARPVGGGDANPGDISSGAIGMVHGSEAHAPIGITAEPFAPLPGKEFLF